MHSSSVRWHSNDKQRFIVPIVITVGMMVIGIGVFSFFRSAGSVGSANLPVAVPDARPAELNGWRIEVAADTPKNGQRFGGKFSLGQVCFMPAGAKFTVRSEPAGIQGMMAEDSSAGTWDHEGGELNPSEASAQECRAPMQAGLYRLAWRSDAKISTSQAVLDILVLTPAETHVQGDRTNVKVNGKSIGNYLDPTQSTVRRVRENANQYIVPKYFAMLTPELINLKLGPDFDLGQLVAFKDSHGPDGKKVYTTIRHTDVLALHPQLIDKLVKLRERLRSKGVKVTRFWITSGFRTPDYNKSIGGAAYSRHCYGDAVDICIDEDDDKKMDDLNGDGRIDRKDGLIIGNACRELELEGSVVPGGIGVYEWPSDDSVASHVHIDCRGYISRWGQIGSGKTKKSFMWWPKAEFQEEDGE